MTAISDLQDAYSYDPYAYDRQRHNAHHLALIRAMEPAQWESPHRAKKPRFTDSEVVELREAYASGKYTFNRLARLFESPVTTVMDAVWGNTYRGVGGTITPPWSAR